MVKVLVIGIDAGSWNVVQPLAMKGKLPTIKKLMENGVWGDLTSCVHYFTSPAWKCYSTGKNPGKLGVCGWWNFDKIEKKLSLVSSASFKSKELWDILGEHGYRCGIVNMPLTFPPKKINGILISGWLSAEKGYTYPPELEQTLENYNYRINPKSDRILDRVDEALLERKDLIKKRFLITEKLLRESNFDFFQLVIFSTDEIQHVFWKQMEDGDPKYGNAIEDLWKLVDSEIGKLLKIVNEDCRIFIISDHGATALKAEFRLNVWLKLKGYLRLKPNKIIPGLLVDTLAKINSRIRKVLPNLPTMFDVLIEQKRLVQMAKMLNVLLDRFDWEKTKAICVDHNLIYINAKGDDNKFVSELIEGIKKIRDPGSGKKIIKDVKTKEEVFKGEYLSSLPDLIVVPEDGYKLCGFPRDRGTKDLWDFSRNPNSGWHRLQGIFLAYGPSIKKGKRIDTATIYDLVPTILHIFDVPIPKDVDGRALKEIFEENSHLSKTPEKIEKQENEQLSAEKRRYSAEEEKAAIERLKSLGYF
jgi:predicted AlkP superfamily phosphohydrolase/phosphomutase